MGHQVKDWRGEINPLGPPANPLTATPLDAAGLEDMERRLSGYTDDTVVGGAEAELGGSDIIILSSPGWMKLDEGTFTPETEVVRPEVELAGTVIGLAKIALELYIGPTALTRLIPRFQGEALQTGVRAFRLPAMGPVDPLGKDLQQLFAPLVDLPSTVRSSPPIDALVPGTELKWELAGAVVGAANGVTDAGITTPGDIAIAGDTDAFGFLRGIVTDDSDDTATILYLGNTLPHQADSAPITVACQAGPGDCAISPDGTVAVRCNSAANSVTVIDTATGKTEHKALPDAGANPLAIAASPAANGFFWVLGMNGELYLLAAVVGSSAWGTNFAGYPTNADGFSLRQGNPSIDAGLEGIITKSTSKQITHISMGTGAVIANPTLSSHAGGFTGSVWPSYGAPVAPELGPCWLTGTDGAGDDYFVPYAAGSVSFGAPFNAAAKNFGTVTDLASPPVKRPSVTLDGRTLFIFSDEPADVSGGHQINQYTIDGHITKYLGWNIDTGMDPGVASGVLTDVGAIVAVGGSTGTVADWFSSILLIRPTSTEGSEAKRVRFVGAS